MTTDRLTTAIKTWLESQIPGTALDGVQIVTTTPDSERVPPFIAVLDAGAQEFSPNKGVITATVAVELYSVPGDDDQEATSQATHQSMGEVLWNALGDYPTQGDFLNSLGTIKSFYISGATPRTQSSADTRQTTIDMEYVVAPII